MLRDELLQQAEGPIFAADLNLASSATVFWDALHAHQVFRELKREAQSPMARTILLSRIGQLASIRALADREHPFDCALAAYSWALSFDRRAALLAAGLLDTAQRIWWARHVASAIRLGPEGSASGIMST